MIGDSGEHSLCKSKTQLLRQAEEYPEMHGIFVPIARKRCNLQQNNKSGVLHSERAKTKEERVLPSPSLRAMQWMEKDTSSRRASREHL
jgi:hypothetical protein